MSCINRESSASAHDPHMVAEPDLGLGGMEAPRPQLTTIQECPVPAPLIAHESAERQSRVVNRLVGFALTILTLLLAAVMFNAGVNVEVLV